MYDAFIETFDRGEVCLAQDEVCHLVLVRRAKAGGSFLGLDGKRNMLLCRPQCNNLVWSGLIIKEIDQRMESHLRVTLGQALLKKDKFEFVIQKATELRVTEIVPLKTKRTEIRLDDCKTERRMKRWERTPMEAVKQAGAHPFQSCHLRWSSESSCLPSRHPRSFS